MKHIKRVIASLLAAATLVGLLILPAGAAGSSSFTDITDPDVAEAAEILRLLGVVDGVGGGAFNPTAPLSRAAFCKMALETQGRGGEAAAQANRVVFPDVTANHWALGYVNAASRPAAEGQPALVSGKGDGKFHPDDNITYAEAVTILMRMLGYGDGDVGAGATWYTGYLGMASQIKLTQGLSLKGPDAISRGQAALLFESLLFTNLKDSETPYLTKLGGSLVQDQIILSTDAKADDGSDGAVQTSGSTYKTDRTTFPASLLGVRGELVLDKDGKLLAVRPEESDTLRRTSVAGTPTANSIPVAGGEKLSIDLETTVWKDGKSTTYESIWQDLRTGTQLVFCYNGAGKLAYLYLPSSGAVTDSVMVAKSKPNGSYNPFTSLAGGESFQLYKNGLPATVADIRQYDVATYDAGARAMYVTDLRLTGMYEDVYPNTQAPSKITVLGKQFDVLDCAVADLTSFKIGDTITLLLTHDGNAVAGAVSSSTLRSSAVGVSSVDESGAATVTLLSGIVLSGQTDYTGDSAAQMDGQLVTVSSSKAGQLTLTKVSTSSAPGSYTPDTGKIGGKPVAENVVLYEKVGASGLYQIKPEDIALATVPASKISYVAYDYAGRVNYMVLDNVTGDGYTYGFTTFTPATIGDPSDWGSSNTPATIGIRYAGSNGTETTAGPLSTIFTARSGDVGGMIATADGKRIASYIKLDSISGVARSEFNLDDMVVATASATLPIWEDVQCYNQVTGRWYAPGKEGLNQARAFSDSLTIYFDRSPEEGGKVRMVVVR